MKSISGLMILRRIYVISIEFDSYRAVFIMK